MKITVRRVARVLAWGVFIPLVVIIPAFVLLTCGLSPSDIIHKLSPSSSSHAAGGPAPSATPAPLVAEHQTEPHTCGYHALSAIYRAYGLSPEDLSLRFRVGTDNQAVPLDATSVGTIHPDIVRVATQDGFRVSMIGTSMDSARRAQAHLASGHPIMVLTRSDAGGLHWVAAMGVEGDPDHVMVYDSLKDDPYERDAVPYLTESAISVILIQPKR